MSLFESHFLRVDHVMWTSARERALRGYAVKKSQARWHMAAIPALGQWRQEEQVVFNYKFEVSLG